MSERKPTGSRRVAREAAYQALYMTEVGKEGAEFAMTVVQNRQPFTDEAKSFLRHLVSGVENHYEELDGKIEPLLAKGWSINRIAVSDLVALRLAAYELIHLPGMPPKVSITEAVELAKRYGTKSSGAFVNGVLGNLLKDTPKAQWDPSQEEKKGDVPDSSESTDEKMPPLEDEEISDEVVEVAEGSEEHEDLMKAGPWVIKADE